jgi:hypothetical protein
MGSALVQPAAQKRAARMTNNLPFTVPLDADVSWQFRDNEK